MFKQRIQTEYLDYANVPHRWVRNVDRRFYNYDNDMLNLFKKAYANFDRLAITMWDLEGVNLAASFHLWIGFCLNAITGITKVL